jgi:hypothetical protein
MTWYNDNQYLLKEFYKIIKKWIIDINFTLLDSHTLFYNNFINMIYKEYYLKENSKINNLDIEDIEYFEMSYESDIVDIFIKFKDLSYNYNSSLFEYNCSSYNLLNFIENNINLKVEEDEDFNNIEFVEMY